VSAIHPKHRKTKLLLVSSLVENLPRVLWSTGVLIRRGRGSFVEEIRVEEFQSFEAIAVEKQTRHLLM
jgi:hypothetical protein